MLRPLPIAALALLLRLALVTLIAPEPQRAFNTDSYEFELLAENLLDAGELTRSPASPRLPEGVRTPGFPAFAALLYGAFGRRPVVVLVANCLLAGAVAALLARACPRRGPWAGLLWAVDPVAVNYGAMFVAETLFAFWLVVAVLLFVRAMTAGAAGAGLGAGIALGLAALTKPAATYLPLAMLAALALLRPASRRAVRPAVALVAGWLLAAGPWMVRNHARLGTAQVSTIQELNLLTQQVAVLEGGRWRMDRRGAEEELRLEIERRAGRPLAELSEPERIALLRALAGERIRAHPFRFAWVHARGALATLLDPGRIGYSALLGGVDWGTSLLDRMTAEGALAALRTLLGRPVALLVPLLLGGLWLLALNAAVAVGLWREGRATFGRPLPLAALAAAVYLVAVGGAIGNARYRVAATPFLALLAAGGVTAAGREASDTARTGAPA